MSKKDKKKSQTKGERIQQILDEAIMHGEKNFYDEDEGEADHTFDVKIDIKENGNLKATIQRKDIDIFELKYLVENLDYIDKSINFEELRQAYEMKKIE